jgi:tripeptidyl-peptidase-1
MLWLCLPLLAPFTFADATPLARRWGEMKVKHAWDSVPSHWEPVGPAPEGTTIDLRIKLKSADADALIATLLEVSDPSHARFVLLS